MSRDVVIVCIDDCAFKFVTCSSSDWVRNVVAYAVGIGAVGHCNEQVVGLDKFDFVDCEAAVNCYGSNSSELPLSNVFLNMMLVMFIWVVLSVLRVDVDFCDERLTFSVDSVS